MNNQEEAKFRALRHRFYKLGKEGPKLLAEMGVLNNPALHLSRDDLRQILFGLHSKGRMAELENLIKEEETHGGQEEH